MPYLYEDIYAADKNNDDYDGFNEEEEDGEEPFYDEEEDDDFGEDKELDEGEE